MRREIKKLERGETGEDIRREGGKMIGKKIDGEKKRNEETKEWIKII